MAETASDTAAEQRRRTELRKVGEQYFAKAISQSNAGVASKAATLPRSNGLPPDAEAPFDADFEAVGAVIDSSKVYVLGAIYVLAQGASWVFLKEALRALGTPAFMVFLHCLPSAGTLWFLHTWSGSSVDIGPLNLRTLKGSTLSTAFHGLQMLTAFGALRNGSVSLLLAWTSLVPQLLQQGLLQGAWKQLRPTGRVGMATGLGGLAVVLLFASWPGVLSLLCLAGWTAVAAGRVLLPALRLQADARPLLVMGGVAAEHVRDLAAGEDSVGAATKAFYESAIPAAPALLLGFVAMEGGTLVDHELSVPAVSSILVSLAAWSAAQVSRLLLRDKLKRQHQLATDGSAACVTLALQLMVFGMQGLPALLGAVAAVVGAAMLQLPVQ